VNDQQFHLTHSRSCGCDHSVKEYIKLLAGSPSAILTLGHMTTVSAPWLTPVRDGAPENEAVEIDSACVLAESARTFQSNPRAEARLLASVALHNIGPPISLNTLRHLCTSFARSTIRNTNSRGCLRKAGYISRQATRFFTGETRIIGTSLIVSYEHCMI